MVRPTPGANSPGPSSCPSPRTERGEGTRIDVFAIARQLGCLGGDGGAVREGIGVTPMDSVKTIFSSLFTVEGLLVAIALLLWGLINEVKGLRRQVEVLIKLRFPELYSDE